LRIIIYRLNLQDIESYWFIIVNEISLDRMRILQIGWQSMICTPIESYDVRYSSLTFLSGWGDWKTMVSLILHKSNVTQANVLNVKKQCYIISNLKERWLKRHGYLILHKSNVTQFNWCGQKNSDKQLHKSHVHVLVCLLGSFKDTKFENMMF